MRARAKLNTACSLGALLVASVAGAIGQSWVLFWLAQIGTMALCYEVGGIRHRPKGRRPR